MARFNQAARATLFGLALVLFGAAQAQDRPARVGWLMLESSAACTAS